MQLRIVIVQQPHQVQIPIEFHLMVQPADDVHFGAAGIDRFLPASQNLLVAHQVAFGFAQIGAKRAENAAVHAHVRGIQVRVDVVVGEVAVLPLAHQVGQFADVVQMHLGRKQQQAVVHVQPLAGLHFGANFSNDALLELTILTAFRSEKFKSTAPPPQRPTSPRSPCIHVEKRRVHPGQIVRLHQPMFVHQQNGNRRHAEPPQPSNQRINQWHGQEKDHHPQVARGRQYPMQLSRPTAPECCATLARDRIRHPGTHK